MKYLIIFSVVLMSFFQSRSSASAIGDSSWQKLIQTALKSGQDLPGDSFTYRALVSSIVNRNQRHDDSFSLLGGYDSHGQFGFFKIELVAENYVLDSQKNTVVDQYIYDSDVSGNLKQIDHNRITFAPSGTMLKYEQLTSPTPEASWQKEIKFLENYYSQN